jgi:hypothetical protein
MLGENSPLSMIENAPDTDRDGLVLADGTDVGTEREAYNRLGLILGHVAIRSKRLGKLEETGAVSSY